MLTFSGTQQGRKTSPWCAFFGGGGMLAVDFSDMLVPVNQTTRRNKPSDRTVNLHHFKALKPESRTWKSKQIML
jgi:hypothetical protein